MSTKRTDGRRTIDDPKCLFKSSIQVNVMRNNLNLEFFFSIYFFPNIIIIIFFYKFKRISEHLIFQRYL